MLKWNKLFFNFFEIKHNAFIVYYSRVAVSGLKFHGKRFAKAFALLNENYGFFS